MSAHTGLTHMPPSAAAQAPQPMAAAVTHPARTHWTIIGAFVTVVGLVAVLGVMSVDVLSAARAFVGGESRWSKAQKEAVLNLQDYLHSRDENAYARFREALDIPLGDRQARLELNQPRPDRNVVYGGLLRGGIHRDDIDGMIRLYRNFGHVGVMATAIAAWERGDEDIARLMALGDTIRGEAMSGKLPPPLMQQRLAELRDINQRLTRTEQLFTEAIGEASRVTRDFLQAGTWVVAGTLTLFGSWLIYRLLQRQVDDGQRLRESNARWALAAESGGIGLLEWDPITDCMTLDPLCAALHGLPAHETERIPSTRLSTYVHPEDRGRAWNALAAVEGVLETRYRVAKPGEGVRHLELAMYAPAHGARRVGIVRDVTDAQMALQLRTDKEATEHATRARSELLARLSHELRTPLNAILGFAQLLKIDDAEPLTPRQHQRVDQMLDSGHRLLGLVNNVLEVSGAGQDAVGLGPVELAPLVERCMARLEPLGQAYGVTMEFECRKGLTARAHAERLSQVLSQLLSNAVKFNRRGGWARVSCREEDDEAAIDVRDSGAGLTPQQQAQLFQPLNRLGAEYTGIEGHGLGLIFALRLLRSMNGCLDLESRPGAGSCFTIRLPRA